MGQPGRAPDLEGGSEVSCRERLLTDKQATDGEVAVDGIELRWFSGSFPYYSSLQPGLWDLDRLFAVADYAIKNIVHDPWQFEFINLSGAVHYLSAYHWTCVFNRSFYEGHVSIKAVRHLKAPEFSRFRRSLLLNIFSKCLLTRPEESWERWVGGIHTFLSRDLLSRSANVSKYPRRSLGYRRIVMKLSSSVKAALNMVLRPAGLELRTTRAERQESARLNDLDRSSHWDMARYGEGFSLDSRAYLRFLEETVGTYRDEYLSFPLERSTSGDGFFLRNKYFGGIDSGVLYAVVRRYQPKVIIEVGSGYSTKVIGKAVADGGFHTKLVSVDPSPRTPIDKVAHERLVCPVEKLSANQIADQLGAGDILFIDSSHTIMTGGDVAFLFLEVLPRLSSGVLVHIHDIFLPFDYPKEWIIGQHWRWTEQYLVHAFLCYNAAFEIVWPSHFMWREHRGSVLDKIPRGETGPAPASLWLVRTGESSQRPASRCA
jgi:hypothetical protein